MERSNATTFVGVKMIENTTGKILPYNDYTDLETYLLKENSYQLSVKVNTDGDYIVETNVWIDWNNDCDFDDAGEFYDLGRAKNVSNGFINLSPHNFTVPVNKINGKVTMRVSTKRDSDPIACQIDFDGEVEDYSLIVGIVRSMWLGYNSDWHNPMNWANGLVPDLTENVIIPASPIGGFYPSVNFGTTAECKSINLENGATINIAGTFIIAE